jgi:hypothetical protein
MSSNAQDVPPTLLTNVDKAHRHSFAFGTKLVFGTINEFGGNIFTGNITYLYSISNKFDIGVGAGIGFVNGLRSWSTSNLLKDEAKREEQMMYSFYARGKFKFSNRPTSLFLLLDVGCNGSSFEDWSAQKYNSLGFFASPALGINIGLPNHNSIALSFGIQGQNTKYNEVKYTYSDLLNKMTYDSFSTKTAGFTGLTFSIEYIF